ncbi:MAG: hypothetical protein JWP37_4226 [Mucilaginibacter sp.]|nr:hypothetical protein [Mucilaginibacter sp.]
MGLINGGLYSTVIEIFYHSLAQTAVVFGQQKIFNISVHRPFPAVYRKFCHASQKAHQLYLNQFRFVVESN